MNSDEVTIKHDIDITMNRLEKNKKIYPIVISLSILLIVILIIEYYFFNQVITAQNNLILIYVEGLLIINTIYFIWLQLTFDNRVKNIEIKILQLKKQNIDFEPNRKKIIRMILTVVSIGLLIMGFGVFLVLYGYVSILFFAFILLIGAVFTLTGFLTFLIANKMGHI